MRPQASEQDPDIIEQETLKKYIAYAKQNCHPKLQNADYDKIAQVLILSPTNAGHAIVAAQGPLFGSPLLELAPTLVPCLAISGM